MVKTLRITSVLAAVLAVVVFSLSVVYGMRTDPEIEQFLESPGVVARFNKTVGDKPRASDNQTSPLVEQAQTLARHLNPPPKPKPVTTTPVVRSTPRTPPPAPRAQVSAKFKLIGTSVHKGDPNMSLAFIDEPGKGLHWVRQSSEVMHLEIVEIRDAVIVVRDNQRTFEVEAEPRPPQVSLEAGAEGAVTAAATSTSPTRTYSPAARSARVETRRTAPSRTPRQVERPQPTRPAPSMNEREGAALGALIERLKNLQRDSDSPDSGSDANMAKVISDFKSSRISNEEAKKLDEMGRELEDHNEDEPNMPRRGGSKIDGSVPRRPPMTRSGARR